jgi:hypothetical protein
MVYNDACKWLRLKHHVYDTRLKNLMEEDLYNRDKRENTECFDDDHFPCTKQNCNRDSMFGTDSETIHTVSRYG